MHCKDNVKYLVVKHTGDETHWLEGRDIDLLAEMAQASPYCPYAEMGAEDPLFILYTLWQHGQAQGRRPIRRAAISSMPP